MRILLVGQKSFGAAVYNRLHQDGHILLVVAPEGDKLWRAAGGGGGVAPGVMQALPYGAWIAHSGVDLVINAHGHEYIRRTAREAAKYGAIGYHPSLLPRHRGKDAVRWAVHMGDPITGGTVYQMTDDVDAGPILRQDWCWVPKPWIGTGETIVGEKEIASELWREKLFPMGVDMLSRVVRELEIVAADGVNHPGLHDQDETYATWEPSWNRESLAAR
jgi:methionyl-tRNA formyltransferase